jgi:hypothetical protein
MAKISRFTIVPFGSNATSGNMGQFGSLAAGDPNYTTDPATIQALAAFLTGWSAETTGDWIPALEDFNGLDFVIFQALCYFQQMGIAEWDAGTTYYTNSFCQVAGVLYKSLVDDNINFAPASNPTKWTVCTFLTADAQTIAGVKTFSSAPVMSAGINNSNQQITGLCIEGRTDDTGCTQTGRIWLRTDL